MPEAHEGEGGEVVDLLGRARPDGGGHGGEIPAEEVFAVAALFDIFGQGEGGKLWVLDFGDGLLVEAVDLEEHLPEAGAEEVASLAEEEVEGAAIELELVLEVLDAEGHRGLLCLNIELFEKASEVRVGDFIINHEAGVDWDLSV